MYTIDAKAGWKTTEFWLAMPIQVCNLLVQIGVIPTGDAAGVSSNVSKVMVGIVAAIGLWHYIKSRAIAKAGGV